MIRDVDSTDRGNLDYVHFGVVAAGILVSLAGVLLTSVTVSLLGVLMIAFGAVYFWLVEGD